MKRFFPVSLPSVLTIRMAIIAAIGLASSVQAGLIYQLEPGSTITPLAIGQPTGPSEPLTGTFTWQPYDPLPDSFAETALTLQSPSFLLALDHTSTDHLLTSIFPATQTSFFGVLVDGYGIPASPLQIAGDPGSYEGPADAPTRLSYSNLYLSPYGGGFHVAVISFDAVLIPKPATWTIVVLGVATLLGTHRRRVAS